MLSSALRASSLPVKILLLALVYLISGRLALLLAIPPGFVSAIFPPVGIILAAVLIWGYPLLLGAFLGSVLLNVSVSVTSLDQLSLQLLPVAMSIATGTTLQCLCACWLIRRVVGFPNALTDERSIFLLLLIGGPLTCLISSSVGAGVLYAKHIIPSSQLLFSWWSWWVGDSIGVLIATPLMFIAFAKPREIWRKRIGVVGLPLLLSCLLMVMLFVRTSDNEQNNLKQRFQEQAKLMTQSLRSRVELYSTAVQAIERFFVSSDNVNREEFASFVSTLGKTNPGIIALSWNARVSAAERSAYEKSIQAEGFPGFSITERDAQDQLIPATARDNYFPITYIEPLASNRVALGFDVASNPTRQRALELARDSAGAAGSAPINLVQDNQPLTGSLLMYPVYSGRQPPVDLAERAQKLRGYVVAVLRSSDVIQGALAGYPSDSYQLQINDVTDASPVHIYGPLQVDVPAYAQSLIWREVQEFAGRRYHVLIAPSESFLQSHRSVQPWAVLAGGLLLCSLLGGFLLSITGRAEQVQRLVRQRTLELSSILDNAAEAILIVTPLGHIEQANPAAEQLFGYNQTQLVGRQLGSLLPSLSNTSNAALQDRLGHTFEVIGQHAELQSLELEISLSSYELPERMRYICLLHNISERKKVERLKNEFVATVSHELRTPLTSIKGSLSLLSAGMLGTLPEPASAMLSIAKENTERLVQLVNDILDIEKLEFGQVALQLQRTDLRAQLRQAQTYNQGYADNFAVHLNLDDSALPEQVPVNIDPLRLQQVLSNLIGNAVKFSEPQGEVQISASLNQGLVRVQVRDHGPGIAEEFRARIFQKFAQADGSDTRQRGGTGLGLSICKALIERMHGSIGFDSQVGQGSTFYFTLPLVE